MERWWYHVVCENNPGAISTKVQEFCDMGWEPQGSVSMLVEPKTGEFYFTQAIKKRRT